MKQGKTRAEKRLGQSVVLSTFFLLHPIYYPNTILLPSRPVVTQIRDPGSHSGGPSPSLLPRPNLGTCLHFYRQKISAFSSLVDSRRIVLFFFFTRIYFPASGQAVVTGVVPSPPWFLPSIFIAHRVQQSHCSSILHRVLLTHALALSASQFVRKKKSPRIYTSMHSRGFELTKLTDTRLEDNLIRQRGDRLCYLPTLLGALISS